MTLRKTKGQRKQVVRTSEGCGILKRAYNIRSAAFLQRFYWPVMSNLIPFYPWSL